MIQDIFPHVYHNEYRDIPAQAAAPLLTFHSGRVLCRQEGERLRYPVCGDFPQRPCHYLFAIDETPYFLDASGEEAALAGFGYESMNVMRETADKVAAFAGITANQLALWYGDNRFCGRCGRETAPDHKERMLFCEHCGNMIYPRISPAVIVAIVSGERLLLAGSVNRPKGRYGLIAGFAEIGESIEQTVHREVKEEVGLKVKNLKFYKSQPWSFSGCLLTGFFVELDGDDTLTLQEEELRDGKWFRRDEIDMPDNGIS
ncbi:MAG: NAD(+) diphosphatase, partial [Ruthenibacterium sp.]